MRIWVQEAIRAINADFNRSADTHLIALHLKTFPGVDIYLKDESSHPTGSLKHRLARSLFLYALSNGWLNEKSTIIESSSGSTAVSEAYFARLIDLPFIAVVPATTSPEKIAAIEFYGGKCHLVEDPKQIYAESARLARERNGHYMDQFTYAERATDWRANNNIAESIFEQMQLEAHPIPNWIVASAGTGGTCATIGRYIRYRGYGTRLLCADPENSVFFDAYNTGRRDITLNEGSLIEGIGRPQVEASFLPSILEAMAKIPDQYSFAAMQLLSDVLGRRVGPSTGTNMMGVFLLAERMVKAGMQGSLVTILCDSGERYRQTCGQEEWLAARDIHLSAAQQALQTAMENRTVGQLVKFSEKYRF